MQDELLEIEVNATIENNNLSSEDRFYLALETIHNWLSPKLNKHLNIEYRIHTYKKNFEMECEDQYLKFYFAIDKSLKMKFINEKGEPSQTIYLINVEIGEDDVVRLNYRLQAHSYEELLEHVRIRSLLYHLAKNPKISLYDHEIIKPSTKYVRTPQQTANLISFMRNKDRRLPIVIYSNKYNKHIEAFEHALNKLSHDMYKEVAHEHILDYLAKIAYGVAFFYNLDCSKSCHLLSDDLNLRYEAGDVWVILPNQETEVVVSKAYQGLKNSDLSNYHNVMNEVLKSIVKKTTEASV